MKLITHFCLIALCGSSLAAAPEAGLILAETGVKGGLVVQVGCGDGKLTAALHANESFIVQALEKDPARLAEARRNIQAAGLYGPVSVTVWDGKGLPYAENMVNLLVSEDLGSVSQEEVMRVLAPLGAAYVQRGGKWTKTIKPWPKELDEWTHWLHDAGNNAVAHDKQVGPPQRMQWVVDPLWSRGHELITSVGAAVTAQGRIMYVVDEGLPGVYSMPSKWVLMARSAFNGVLLWRRPVPEWDAPVVRGGHTGGFKPRRFTTDGERLFLPMGENAVLTSVDTATGKTLKTLAAAKETTDILCQNGIVVAVTHPSEKKGNATLLAARADTLEILWQTPMQRLMAQSVGLDGQRVYCCAANALTALDLKTGKPVWHTPLSAAGTIEFEHNLTASLVVADGKVYFLASGNLTALWAESGKVVWESKNKARGKWGGLFIANGMIWRFDDPKVQGYDASTGKLSKTIDASCVFSEGHHLRCYPPKATDDFMITQNRGAEFVGLTSSKMAKNDWVRGNCGHGVMPANGLLYAPPNQCFCYGGVMVSGFKALAAGPVPAAPADPAHDATRLEKGPAYGELAKLSGEVAKSDWPMYRHDAGRLGAIATEGPAELGAVWQAKLGGKLTQPIMAGGLVYVAATEAHTVYGLDAATGKTRWSYSTGGRIDSAPTYHEGLVMFGSADGWAYCLRASDGQLAWRFHAAPTDRRVGAFGQIECAWPVHGSTVVLNGIAYFTAGRSTYLDGGIYAYGLEPKTGRVVYYRLLEGEVADGSVKAGEKAFVPAFAIEGARSDLLVSDGQYLFLGPLKFDAKLQRQPTPYVAPQGKTTGMDLTKLEYIDKSVFAAGKKRNENKFTSLGVLRGPMGDKTMGLHLLSTGGFLDDSYYNRNFWMYSKVWPGFYIANLSARAGELLVIDQKNTYCVQAYPERSIHSPIFEPGTKGYLLFADDNTTEPVLDDETRGRDKGMGFTRSVPPKWFQFVPVRVRAMVKAGNTLYVAGPPDVLEEKDPYAAFEGRKGAKLWAINPNDGRKVAEISLGANPVFDGLMSANGRLFLSSADGTVTCLGKK